MGILSDFFVADRTAATDYELSLMDEDGEEGAYVVAQHKGFTGLEVARLHALLLEEPFDVGAHTFEVISTEDHDGLTEAFPESLTESLAAIESESFERVSKKWAEDMREEATHDPIHLATVLQNLKKLAQTAKAEGKGLFLWYSV